jgi:hypothetical protein
MTIPEGVITTWPTTAYGCLSDGSGGEAVGCQSGPLGAGGCAQKAPLVEG